jgi:Zn-finger nucleic acid-binding protein
MSSTCKHPRVRVVSRQDDAEFVECELCREVFDSGEFDDMMIEEKQLAEAEKDAESPPAS